MNFDLTKVTLLHVNPVTITAHRELTTTRGHTAVGAVWFEQPTEEERALVQECGRNCKQFIEVMPSGEICLSGEWTLEDKIAEQYRLDREEYKAYQAQFEQDNKKNDKSYEMLKELHKVLILERPKMLTAFQEEVCQKRFMRARARPLPSGTRVCLPNAEEVADFIGREHLTSDSIQPTPAVLDLDGKPRHPTLERLANPPSGHGLDTSPATARVELPNDENLYCITEFQYKGPTITAKELDEWLTLHAKPAFERTTGLKANRVIVTDPRLALDVMRWEANQGSKSGLVIQMGFEEGSSGSLAPDARWYNSIFLAHQCENGALIVAVPRSNAVEIGWINDPTAAGLCDPGAVDLLQLLQCCVTEFVCKVNALTKDAPAAKDLRELGFAPLSRWIAAMLCPDHQHLYLKKPFAQPRPISGENYLHISWKAPAVENKDGSPLQECSTPSAGSQYIIPDKCVFTGRANITEALKQETLTRSNFRRHMVELIFRRSTYYCPPPFDSAIVYLRLPSQLWECLRQWNEAESLRDNLGDEFSDALRDNKPFNSVFGYRVAAWDGDNQVTFWAPHDYEVDMIHYTQA